MQKTLSGQHSHLDTVPIAIFDNDQDIDAWRRGLPIMRKPPAALQLSLRGHGLTCWGKIFRRPAVNWRGWSSCSSAS